MGLAEVLPHLPRLIKRLNQTIEAVLTLRPDVVVTVDSPDFCLRVAHRLHGSGIPVVHYVAPQLWAWRPGRARRLAKRIDHLMALLPFEVAFFAKYGISTTFVGHPAIESGAGRGNGPAFRAEPRCRRRPRSFRWSQAAGLGRRGGCCPSSGRRSP